MSGFRAEAAGQAASLGLSLYRRVESFFQDKKNRQDFERWFKAKYGRPYVWKKKGGG